MSKTKGRDLESRTEFPDKPETSLTLDKSPEAIKEEVWRMMMQKHLRPSKVLIILTKKYGLKKSRAYEYIRVVREDVKEAYLDRIENITGKFLTTLDELYESTNHGYLKLAILKTQMQLLGLDNNSVGKRLSDSPVYDGTPVHFEIIEKQLDDDGNSDICITPSKDK